MERAINPNSLKNLTAPRFKPGQSGNPSGTAGLTRRLDKQVVAAFLRDFEAHGEGVIALMRVKDPVAYMRTAVALLPKRVEVSSQPLEDLNDDDLAASITALRGAIAARVGEGAGEAQGPEQTSGLQTLPKAG